MQKIYSHVIGQPVVRINDGEILAMVIDLIIDPETGKIEGILVKTNEFPGSKLVLRPRDIREWKLKIYVDDETALSEIDDVLKVAQLWREENTIFLKKVVTTDGIYLGQVYDFNFDVETGKLINLFIIKKFLFFTLDRRIVPITEIVEIRKDAIIVKSDIKVVRWRRKKIIDLKSFVFTPDPEPMMNK